MYRRNFFVINGFMTQHRHVGSFCDEQMTESEPTTPCTVVVRVSLFVSPVRVQRRIRCSKVLRRD